MRPTSRRPVGRLLAGSLAVLLLVGACGAGGEGSGPEVPPPPPWHDPPLTFGPESGRLFGDSGAGAGTGVGTGAGTRSSGELPAVLSGDTVWLTVDGRLEQVDAAGRATAAALPPGRTARGRPVLDPPERGAGGGPGPERVLTAAVAVIPGVGTTPPGLAAEVLAVDPGTRTVVGSVAVPLPWTARADVVRMRVFGPVPIGTVTGTGAALPGSTGARSVVVVSAATDTERTTAGVDPDSGEVAWVARDVEAGALVGSEMIATATPPGSTVSYSPSDVVVLDPRTGERGPVVASGLRAPTVTPAGPALAAVGGRTATTSLFGTGSTSMSLVGPDGRTVGSIDTGDGFTAPRCVWDRASVTVCATEAQVVAVDATDGTSLWSLPDPGANRVAPRVTGAWRGAVYGTTVNGPVVLDARTGADRETRPGVAPVLVNGRLGIALDGGGVAGFGGRVTVHPALG